MSVWKGGPARGEWFDSIDKSRARLAYAIARFEHERLMGETMREDKIEILGMKYECEECGDECPDGAFCGPEDDDGENVCIRPKRTLTGYICDSCVDDHVPCIVGVGPRGASAGPDVFKCPGVHAYPKWKPFYKRFVDGRFVD